MKKNPKVDAYLRDEPQWRDESAELRKLALAAGLTEEIKWGKPCYSLAGRNVVIIQGFKESCALLFCKGALLRDPMGILERPGENSQGARRVRFTSRAEIVKLRPFLAAYLKESIAAEKAGLQVVYRSSPEPVPAELQARLDASRALKAAFVALTPGRRRGYILHISGAKQSETRATRVRKCEPAILAGKGMMD